MPVKNHEKLKKFCSVVSTLLVAVVLLVAVFLVGTRLMGFRVFHVISPSMTPVYNVGDLIFVKEVDPASIEVGDDITFIINEAGMVGTHRVVEVDPDNQHFYTKGVANNTADASPVHFKNVLGTPVFKLPWLGYVSVYVQGVPGRYVALGIGLVLTVLVFLPDILGKSRNLKQKQDLD